jgi:hypothetical protein
MFRSSWKKRWLALIVKGIDPFLLVFESDESLKPEQIVQVDLDKAIEQSSATKKKNTLYRASVSGFSRSSEKVTLLFACGYNSFSFLMA